MGELVLKSGASISKKVFELAVCAYQNKVEERLRQFFKYADTRYETISQEDCKTFSDYTESQQGLNLLTEYAESIVKTSSSTVRMAIALLYCRDPEFSFTKEEIRNFIAAALELDEDLVDFFIKIKNVSTNKTHVYPRGDINSNNFEQLFDGEWDAEAIFADLSTLIRLRLLLPDPAPTLVGMESGASWSFPFGVTARSIKFIQLLEKARLLKDCSGT